MFELNILKEIIEKQSLLIQIMERNLLPTFDQEDIDLIEDLSSEIAELKSVDSDESWMEGEILLG